MKQSFTPEEKLRVAYGHLILGMKQHDIAALFGINAGRVAEAINDVREAIDWEKQNET